MINLAEIIANELRKRGLDTAWSDRGQIRVVWDDGTMTFTIINDIIHCWDGEYSLFENRPLDEFIEAVTRCGPSESCVGCSLHKGSVFAKADTMR